MKVRFGMLLGILCTLAISPAVSAAAVGSPASPAESNVAAKSSSEKRTTENKEVELKEVIVTARKRKEQLLEVPESIAAISASDIVAEGIETADDLGRHVSNLQLNTRQDLTPNVVIRGVGAYGIVAGVGFTVDDVPNYTDQTMRVEDLQSIQVAKGPQGTLYGGSAIGGEVIYTSKRPRFDFSGEESVETGDFGTLNVYAAQNLPLIPNTISFRVSGYDARSNGWITNNELGVDGNPLRDYGVRAELLDKLSDNVTAQVTVRYSSIVSGGNEYTPVPSITSFSYDTPAFQPQTNRRTTDGAILRLDADVGEDSFVSISSYTRSVVNQNVDASFSPPGVPGQITLTLPGERPAEVVTQEFRLTSPGGGAFDWLVGLYGAEIDNLNFNQVAVANYPPPPMTALVIDYDTRRTDLAGFGTVDYRIGQLTLGAGARVEESRFRAHVFIEAGGLPNQSAAITSKAVLPKVSISYELPNRELLYADVATGEEPGAINTLSVAPIPYKAERALSYEVGSKGQALAQRVDYEIAAFYVDHTRQQFQTNQYIPSLGGQVMLTSNIGDSRSYGIEADTSWRATRTITFEGSAGYLNSRWKEAVAFGLPIHGNTIPNAPEFTASLRGTYSRQVARDVRFDFSVDASYTSEFWWDLFNTPGTQEPAYWFVTPGIAIGSPSGSWTLSFRVPNALGTKFWTEYFPNLFSAPPYPCDGCASIGAIGVPREYRLSLTLKH